MAVQKITKQDILVWLSLVNQEIAEEETELCKLERGLIKNFAKENGLDSKKLCNPNKSEEEWDENDESAAEELEDLRFNYQFDFLNPLLADKTALQLLKYNIARPGKNARKLHQGYVFEKLDVLKDKDGQKIKDTIKWLQDCSLLYGSENYLGYALAEYGIKFYDEVYGNDLRKEWRDKDKELKGLEGQGKENTRKYKGVYNEMKKIGTEILRFKTVFSWETQITH